MQKRRGSTRIRTRRKTAAEILYGRSWVSAQWERAWGLLKGRGPKDPVAWQRRQRQDRRAR